MRMPRVISTGSCPRLDRNHADLAAVIGIDSARAVEHRDPVLQRQARARSHLRFITGRQGKGDSGRDQRRVRPAVASPARRPPRPDRARRFPPSRSRVVAVPPCGRRITSTGTNALMPPVFADGRRCVGRVGRRSRACWPVPNPPRRLRSPDARGFRRRRRCRCLAPRHWRESSRSPSSCASRSVLD